MAAGGGGDVDGRGLEGGHPDDVGVQEVGRAGGVFALGRGDGRRGQGDHGRRNVGLVAVQRRRLPELGVQTGTTGTTEGERWGEERERMRECERERASERERDRGPVMLT